MSDSPHALEAERLIGQKVLDNEKTPRERNEMGQFATPPMLADDVMEFALSELHAPHIDFLEPSCGSGSFLSALYRSSEGPRARQVTGVEIDERFAELASSLWGSQANIINGDYLGWVRQTAFRPNLLVANPPYVRHHHIPAAQKLALGQATQEATGIKVSGLAGLYVYFMLLTHKVLSEDAVSAWLIPTEFMDVNYGVALREYLATTVELIKIHRFDPSDVQFADALVSSAVVVFRNRRPSAGATAEFTYGGSVHAPERVHKVEIASLKAKQKWIRHFDTPVVDELEGREALKDLFTVRRGIATGSNEFFVRPRSELLALGIREEHITPVLPSARRLKSNVVEADEDGWAALSEQLGLINCVLPPEKLSAADPALMAVLNGADETVRGGYLVKKRTPWYKQEQRPAPPLLCTYMGRGGDDVHPFKFIRNESQATATNTYLLLYPKQEVANYIASRPDGLERVHHALLRLTAQDLRDGGRSYGGGLRKIEPKELGMLNARVVRELLSNG
ncbi:hypothetical protein [Paenarthrobacter sp. 4246]|uniref:Eco57I restriction-modification methylase domain-containing protein n=1 Tax=Paenarthrobacter sp. 4246 TaxID=3156456 RepID=UPI003391573C